MKIARLMLTIVSSLLVSRGSLLAQGGERGEPPPWAVESPGAAGARFALGLDYGYDREDGLRISSATSVVTLRDLLSGRTDTSTVNNDPALLNRKFDIRWTATGEGAQIPIALRPLRLDGVEINPTLVLQAASTGLTLRFFDRPEPADSTALTGRAAIFGMGLTLTSPLCRSCPWFASAGYRWSEIRPFAARRSPAFDGAGFTVLEDQTRLRLRRDEGLLRIGRSLAAGRVAPYLGWVRRRDLLRDDDTLALRSEQAAEETMLTSRTRLGATTTAGLAGIEARLARPLLLRVEAIFGSRHLAVALKVAYLRLPPPPDGHPPRQRTREEIARRRTAVSLAQRLAEILPGVLEGFQAQRRKLLAAGGGGAYPKDGIAALLDSTEAALVGELSEEELAPVRDYVDDVFQKARSDLGLSTRTARRPSSTFRVALASLRAVADEPPASGPRLERGWADRVLDGVGAFMKGLYERATKKDFLVDLCVVSVPTQGAQVKIRSRGEKESHDTNTTDLLQLYRGKYFYTVINEGIRKIDCEASSQCSPIDLWVMRQPPLLDCDLNKGNCKVRKGGWPDACR